MARLLGSDQGQFPSQNVRSLADEEATHKAILDVIEATFSGVQADDAVFAYMAGHGEVVAGEYYFIAHDTTAQGIAINGVPLKKIKEAFDTSPSQRAFLWLDFCHSGGIIPRDLGTEPDDREVISRALEVVQGQGKLIVAACTPGQKAYESAVVGHGLFTDALLQGSEGRGGEQGRGHCQLAVRLHRQADGQRPTATDDVRADDGAGRPDALCMILLTCQGLDRGGWAVPRLLAQVPLSPVDLGLVLLSVRNSEVNACVARHWTDSEGHRHRCRFPGCAGWQFSETASELSHVHLIITRRKW